MKLLSTLILMLVTSLSSLAAVVFPPSLTGNNAFTGSNNFLGPFTASGITTPSANIGIIILNNIPVFDLSLSTNQTFAYFGSAYGNNILANTAKYVGLFGSYPLSPQTLEAASDNGISRQPPYILTNFTFGAYATMNPTTNLVFRLYTNGVFQGIIAQINGSSSIKP